MRSDDHKLGFPKRTIGMSSGGASTEDSFDEMFESAELDKVKLVNTVIHSLDQGQKDAIYHFHLGTKAPQFKEFKYQLAIDNLLTMVGKRIS